MYENKIFHVFEDNYDATTLAREVQIGDFSYCEERVSACEYTAESLNQLNHAELEMRRC